ncbi:MAG: OprO/OprP family phosphate-selective porin [Mediterranea sp.]|jgi:hypothetical protein|nr:OprO/OprP family phosphate-selective porin [Mediterranea sp.]
MQRSLLLLAVLLPTAAVQAQNFVPEIHGTIRTKYEYQTEMDASRFEVRTARISASGQVLPIVAYKAEVDLCDEGQIKMLDAYARLTPLQGFSITAGQMRVPFTVDAFRSPHLQYFANRSFIAKQVGNTRDVGATLAYKFGETVPLTVEGGIFNGSGLTNQKVWHKETNYAAKVQAFLSDRLNLTVSTLSIQPQKTRMSSYDFDVYYSHGPLHVEAEYLYKSYSGNAYDDVHAFNSFVNYNIPLKKFFHRVALLARYDMMTNQSDAVTTVSNDDPTLKTTDYKRHRVTGGVTLSFDKAIRADLRLNFEKYFYPSGSIAKESERDKLVVELMLRF